MKPFDEQGQFWLPAEPSQKVHGRLVYTPSEGATLHLTDLLISKINPYPVIHGTTYEHGSVTLADSFLVRQQAKPLQGKSRQELSAGPVFLGAHLPPLEELRISVLEARFIDLESWLNPPFWDFPDAEQDPADVLALRTELRIPKPQPFALEFGDVSFINDVSHSGSEYRDQFEVTPWARFELEIGLSLDQCFEQVLLPMQNLLSLAGGSRSKIVDVRLPAAVVGGRAGEPAVTVILREMRGDQRGQTDRYDLLFRLADLQPLLPGALARWFGAWQTKSHVLGLFFSVSYREPVQPAVRFLGVVGALEAYHRTLGSIRPLDPEVHRKLVDSVLQTFPEHAPWLKSKIQWNEPTLRDRLQELFGTVRSRVGIDEEGLNRVVKLAADTRNYLIHLDPKGRSRAASGWDLFDLGETLTAIVEALLLKDLGFSEEKTASLLGHARNLRGRRYGSR